MKIGPKVKLGKVIICPNSHANLTKVKLGKVIILPLIWIYLLLFDLIVHFYPYLALLIYIYLYLYLCLYLPIFSIIYPYLVILPLIDIIWPCKPNSRYIGILLLRLHLCPKF